MATGPSASTRQLDALVAKVRACTACEPDLPFGPRPILSVPSTTRLLIIGQAPGSRVHASGVFWDDRSGDHLREWLRVDRETFYGSPGVGVLPMGFCYPGKRKGGDAPPRPECAPLWHRRILDVLQDVELTLLIGRHAHRAYLPKAPGNGTELVRRFREYLPERLPLPHPSWRSKIWMGKNPWFERDVLPQLRELVQQLLG